MFTTIHIVALYVNNFIYLFLFSYLPRLLGPALQLRYFTLPYVPFFFCRCSYSVSSVSGVFIFLDFTLLLSLLWTCPSSVWFLFLGVVAMVLLCGMCRGCFGLLLLACGVLLCRIVFCCSICPLTCLSIVCECTQFQTEARSPRDFVCLLSVWNVSLSTHDLNVNNHVH